MNLLLGEIETGDSSFLLLFFVLNTNLYNMISVMSVITVILVVIFLTFHSVQGFYKPTTTRVVATKSVKSFNKLSMHFEEALVGNTKLTSAFLPRERYIATNRFHVRSNNGPKFEKRW